MPFTATKRTTSAFSKDDPQLDVSAGKVYFVWEEPDVDPFGKDQIWTAVMNIDGTGFVATQRTISAFDKNRPQLQVSGSKIHYVWQEEDPVSQEQIWTAVMNLDGTGFVATERTNTNIDKRGPYLQVVGNKIYYVWREKTGAGEYSIWTAVMNTDGTGWSANKRQVITLDGTHGVLAWIVRQHVVGSKIYYIWTEHDGADYEIWTAVMNIDGSDWTATKRRTSPHDIRWVTLYVYGNNIYYAWYEEDDAGLSQIWTGMMGTDGTNWTATKRTEGDWWLYNIELAASGNTVYYACTRVKSAISQSQVWTAEMNVDGTGWELTQRTSSDGQYHKRLVQQKIGSDIHYVWKEMDDDDYWQIWTGRLPLPEAQPIIALIG